MQTQAVYLALALTISGEKELLGLWVGEAEAAKFWLSMAELKNRRVRDLPIAAIDGLSGFPGAIASVFPHAQVQLYIVHMVPEPFRYVASHLGNCRTGRYSSLRSIASPLTTEHLLQSESHRGHAAPLVQARCT